MNCAYCSTPLVDGSRFCMTCGADLSDPEVSSRTRAAVRELFETIRVAVEGRYKVTASKSGYASHVRRVRVK